MKRRWYHAWGRGMYAGRFRMSRRVARRQRKVGWILVEDDGYLKPPQAS